jgi:hypothetical protein
VLDEKRGIEIVKGLMQTRSFVAFVMEGLSSPSRVTKRRAVDVMLAVFPSIVAVEMCACFRPEICGLIASTLIECVTKALHEGCHERDYVADIIVLTRLFAEGTPSDFAAEKMNDVLSLEESISTV